MVRNLTELGRNPAVADIRIHTDWANKFVETESREEALLTVVAEPQYGCVAVTILYQTTSRPNALSNKTGLAQQHSVELCVITLWYPSPPPPPPSSPQPPPPSPFPYPTERLTYRLAEYTKDSSDASSI
ncbi:hypothetical protein PoB_000535300 [Plakobranchus ocellatus]|uniref:Uncharacterized protein n=1 Tax=Plakobranchus ocellatus TaxID=259542 RepID=A0AAV3Y9M6_9GAST|nr:hypothetical protein PoB_000535300 [Plakobranchus ocellatus]